MKAIKDIEVKVKVNIRPGPVTPAMRHAWDIFWKRLIASAKSEVKAGER